MLKCGKNILVFNRRSKKPNSPLTDRAYPHERARTAHRAVNGRLHQDICKLLSGNIGGGDKWWIDSEETPDGNRQKTDLILYNRASGTDIDTLVGYVECATCHDPHAGESQSFLRMGSNDNSQVCLACHIK